MTDLTNLQQQQEIQIAISDLGQHTIQPAAVREAFAYKHQLALNSNEILKVSKQDEGKKIKFQTYDNYSVIINIDAASMVGNKEPQVKPGK